MPEYVIHLAIAKRYQKNNKVDLVNDFIDGNIIVDEEMFAKKPNNHGWGGRILEESKSKTEGRVLHLLVDAVFDSLGYFWSTDIHNDYKVLNKSLIDEYELFIPKRISSMIEFSSGKLKVISEDEIYSFVTKFDNVNLKAYQKVLDDAMRKTRRSLSRNETQKLLYTTFVKRKGK